MIGTSLQKRKKKKKKTEGKEDDNMNAEMDISKNSLQKNTQGTDEKKKEPTPGGEKNNFSLMASKGDDKSYRITSKS